MTVLTSDLSYCCRSGDTSFHTNQRQIMGNALYRDNWHKEVKAFYEQTTLRLLHEKSCKIAGTYQVDITREYVRIGPLS